MKIIIFGAFILLFTSSLYSQDKCAALTKFVQLIETNLTCKDLVKSDLFNLNNNCKDYRGSISILKSNIKQYDSLSVHSYNDLIAKGDKLVVFNTKDSKYSENVCVLKCSSFDLGFKYYYFLIENDKIISFVLITKDNQVIQWLYI